MRVAKADPTACGRDAEDLIRHICRGLHAAKNLFRSGPERGPVSETAILLYSARGLMHLEPVRPLLSETAEVLLPFARSRKNYERLCTDPAHALDIGLAHRCLSVLGYADPAFEELLTNAALKDHAYAKERLPHKAVQQEWIRRMGRPGRTSLAMKRAILQSIVASPMAALTSTPEDLCAAVHTLAYATDFGAKSVRLPRTRQEIAEEAEGALARAIDQQNHELAAELLLTWPIVGVPWSSAALFAFEFLSGLPEDPVIPMTKPYGMDYAMAQLSAITLQFGRAVPLPPERFEVAEELHQMLDSDGVRRPWMDRWAPSDFMLAVIAWRAVEARDLGRLHRLLVLSERLGISRTPVHVEAAHYLRRAEILSRVCPSKRAASA